MATFSMTGFGRGAAVAGGYRAEAELSSVNRKQFDCSLSLPAGLGALEDDCRAAVRARISRGHVQLAFRLETEGECAPAAAQAQPHETGASPLPERSAHAIRERVAQLRALADVAGVPFELRLRDLLRMPDMLAAAAPSPDPEAARPAIMAALADALDSHAAMRVREGAALREDLERRVEALEAVRRRIAERAPLVPVAARDALRRRIAELGSTLQPDDPALAREVAIIADRCDISEELTRLKAHFDHVRALFDSPEPCGRKLDFLAQEMNRECNTIGSKAADATIAAAVVEAKALVETFREQVQNLE